MNGFANTGGGGGGACGNVSPFQSGGGGSGTVIVYYSDIYIVPIATTGSPIYMNIGGYRIYKWTGSGSITF